MWRGRLPAPYMRAVCSAIRTFAIGVADQWYPMGHYLWAFLLWIVVCDQWTGLHESVNRRIRYHNKVNLPDGASAWSSSAVDREEKTRKY